MPFNQKNLFRVATVQEMVTPGQKNRQTNKQKDKTKFKVAEKSGAEETYFKDKLRKIEII